MNIREDLLHYIWKTKNFDQSDLRTTDGREVTIVDYGTHNDDAGPDFLNGRIEINDTQWAGHIEIHIKASDWIRHNHDGDDGYQNVILHVVYDADDMIHLKDGTAIPCLELRSRMSMNLISKVQYLQNNTSWIPCEDYIASANDMIKVSTKSRALIERLTGKANLLKQQLEVLNNDLNELIYQRLAWAFGLRVNAEAMITLVKSIKYKILQKHCDQLFQMEALFFGQSGMITDDQDDPYVAQLLKEYKMMKQKYRLTPMASVQWKFSRLRPSGFPTLRIAQFAQFMHQVSRLDELIFTEDASKIKEALNVQLSGYWMEHYRFGIPSIRKNKVLGESTKSIIIINAIVPILYMYGIIRKNEHYKAKAIGMLESLKPELNSITKRWESLGMDNESAADSQALLQLKKENCDRQKCMSCQIGHHIIS